MDYVDMLVDTKDEYLTGNYYKARPKTENDGAIPFKYKQLDPNSRVFDKVLGNIRADSERYAIKTNDKCGFIVGGYISTQNGLCWEITDVITNEESHGSNNALRWFKSLKNAECSVRMIRVDNLFNEEEIYTNTCLITVIREVDIIDTAIIQVYGSEEVVPYNISFDGKEMTFEVPKGSSVRVELSVPGKLITFDISNLFTKGNTCEWEVKE